MKASLLAFVIATVLGLRGEAAEVKERATIDGFLGMVFSVAFSPDDKNFAVSTHLFPKPLGDKWGMLSILNVPGGNRQKNGYVDEALFSLTFTPDGKTLAAASFDSKTKRGEILLFKVKPLEQVATLRGHQGSVRAIAISRDGKWLASGGGDELKLWNLATRKERLSLEGHTKAILSVAFSPDGMTLASASAARTVKLWDVATGKLKVTLTGHEDKVTSVCFSPDGKTLASGSWDRTIRLWNPETGKALLILAKHDHKILALAYSPDGKFLAGGGGEGIKAGELRLWEARTGKEKTHYAGYKCVVNSLAFRPNGKVLASGALNGRVRVWDVPGKTKEELAKDAAAIASFNRAVELKDKQAYGEAIKEYAESIRLNPNAPRAYNGLAWLLATCPKDGVRDGKKAVEYATKACQLTGWKDAESLDNLAAALAETGDFKGAVRRQKAAVELRFDDEDVLDGARARLKLYQASKPYRDE